MLVLSWTHSLCTEVPWPRGRAHSWACPVDGSIVQPMPPLPARTPTFPLPLPGAWKRGAGSCAFRLSVAAVPHHLQTVCAWRVTTGLNPQRGADSDSGVLVAPGITVSLANWPNSLDFLFFLPLDEVEVKGKLINVPCPNSFVPSFCAVSFILQGPLVRSPLTVGSHSLPFARGNRGSA